MILLIDNYDSFSYNLYQLTASIQNDVKVIRNDAMTVEEIKRLAPTHILLSPGPGYPKDAGICEEVVQKLAGQIPILGVCLGHQSICEVFGMTISHAKKLMHGKQSKISIDNSSILFKRLPDTIAGARYHSLVAKEETVPDCLKVVARDPVYGEIMAVEHNDYPVYGLQFHPESILTPKGRTIMENFLSAGIQ